MSANKEIHEVIKSPGIHRFLVTGVNEDALQAFHFQVAMMAGPIEARGLTVFYTVPCEHIDLFMTQAAQLLVTVQQRVPDPPFWNVVFLGLGEPWAPAPVMSAEEHNRFPKGRY